MAATLTQYKKVLFDPGFTPNILAFLPMMQNLHVELSKLKTFEQRQIKFKILNKGVIKALKSTIGFWVGQMMWLSYLKRCSGGEKCFLLGNQFMLTNRKTLAKAAEAEFMAMEKYIQTYSQNVMYYTNESDKIPNYYLRLIQIYREFAGINTYFTEAETTQDIIIPDSLSFFEHLNQNQLERIHHIITHIIDKGDLSDFLELGLVQRL